MARTYRCRNSAPSGAVVRDDGRVYFPDCCPDKAAQLRSWLRSSSCRCNDLYFTWTWRNYRRQERKAYRKAHYRQYRAKTKDRMHHEKWEMILPYRRTSGWLSR